MPDDPPDRPEPPIVWYRDHDQDCTSGYKDGGESESDRMHLVPILMTVLSVILLLVMAIAR